MPFFKTKVMGKVTRLLIFMSMKFGDVKGKERGLQASGALCVAIVTRFILTD